jgi:hypothetical protein
VAEKLDNDAVCHRLGENKVLHRVVEERNIIQTEKRRKANWIGHILFTTCLIKQVTEGKIAGTLEITGKGGKTRKQLLDDLKKTTGYCNLNKEALAFEEATDLSYDRLRNDCITCYVNLVTLSLYIKSVCWLFAT